MITVWLATFPAMFYGMYNIGLQANDVLALSGGTLDGWRGGIVAALGGTTRRISGTTCCMASCIFYPCTW